MPAYVIGDIDVHDPDRYRDYAAGAPATVEQHGGRSVVRGGEPEAVEGDWPATRIVVLEFPDRAAARAWIDGEAYAPLREQRQAAAAAGFVLVDGRSGSWERVEEFPSRIDGRFSNRLLEGEHRQQRLELDLRLG